MKNCLHNSKIRQTGILSVLSVLFLFIQLSAQEINKSYDIKFNQKIPTRDGTNLSATILLPSPLTEPVPALFIFTPYVADRYLPQAQYFVKNGFVVVISDIRGRGNSEGSVAFFDPIVGKDGSDVCEWISKQTWCNGKIGMLGGSYSGMVQWQILKEHPKSLRTIIPTAAVVPGIDSPFRNNIYYNLNATWLALVNGKTLNLNSMMSSNEFWNKVYLLHFTGKRSYRDLILTSGLKSNAFDTWLKHPTLDNHWKRLSPTKQDYSQFAIPVLTITGYYDDDQRGAMHYYNDFMKYAPPEAQNKHYLLIGPWNHAGTRHPAREIYDLKFGENAIVDINKIQLEWFNWTLKNRDRPEFIKDKVTYFIMGENRWQYADHLTDISNNKLILYLSSDNGDATDIFHSGHLKKSPPLKQKPDSFIYNPLDSTYFASYLSRGPWVDMSLYGNKEAYKKNQLIYHSEPSSEDLTIAGQIRFFGFIETNVKDTDFEYLVYEVRADGSEIFLTTDILRARYRRSLEEEELVTPGKIYKYDFKTSYLFVRKIKKGSRIRFVFRALDNPAWQKNFNSGSKVEDETEKAAVTAIIKLYHDKEHPSYIEIPILK